MTAATAKSGALTTESLAPFKFLTGSGSCANGTCTFGGSTSAGLPVGVTVGHGTAPPPGEHLPPQCSHGFKPAVLVESQEVECR